MMKHHLRMHGQTYARHYADNWHFTTLALKAAAFTLGHAITPRISGKRASQLHDELWDLGRTMSIEDHRLNPELYPNRDAALRDFNDHAALYNEQPRLEPFRDVVEQHFTHTQ
jgi:hypothetical protein